MGAILCTDMIIDQLPPHWQCVFAPFAPGIDPNWKVTGHYQLFGELDSRLFSNTVTYVSSLPNLTLPLQVLVS